MTHGTTYQYSPEFTLHAEPGLSANLIKTQKITSINYLGHQGAQQQQSYQAGMSDILA